MSKNATTKQVGGDHYQRLQIQPIDFITDNNIPYREANVIKYVARHRAKGGLADIKKAMHYLEMILGDYQKNGSIPQSDTQVKPDGDLFSAIIAHEILAEMDDEELEWLVIDSHANNTPLTFLLLLRKNKKLRSHLSSQIKIGFENLPPIRLHGTLFKITEVISPAKSFITTKKGVTCEVSLFPLDDPIKEAPRGDSLQEQLELEFEDSSRESGAFDWFKIVLSSHVSQRERLYALLDSPSSYGGLPL